MANRDLARLYHMFDCAKVILEFSANKKRQDLDSDRLFASAIMREFEILGEAASAISKNARSQFSEIPWKEIIGMRNQLIHAYFDVDNDIIWSTIHLAIPDLIPKIEKAINLLMQHSKSKD